MTKKCCAKQNVITYADGTGVCQSCGTTFNGDEAVTVVQDAEAVAALTLRVDALEGENSELKRQIEEAKDSVASLEQRVLTLEGRVTQ